MQSSVTTVTATANASASAMSDDWSNVMGTLLSSNWSKLAPAAVSNFGMLLQIMTQHTTPPSMACGICLAENLGLLIVCCFSNSHKIAQLGLNQNNIAH